MTLTKNARKRLGSEARAAILRAKRMAKRAKRPPLSDRELVWLYNRVLSIACNGWWLSHAANEADVQGINPKSRDVRKLLADYAILPPPEDHGQRGRRRHPVVMLRCHLCDRLTPPNNTVSTDYYRLCEDCASGTRVSTGHVDLIIEGVRDCRGRVYDQLRQIGLKDREIAVLSLRADRRSIREIAELCGIGKTWVSKLIETGKAKLIRAGHPLADPPQHPAPNKRTVPNDVLDEIRVGPGGTAVLPASLS